jgi:hypothetical protein
MVLDLRRPDSFDVARSRQIEVSPGDKILIRANNKRLGLTNVQVLTVSGVVPAVLFRPRRASVSQRIFGNGATVTWLSCTRLGAGQPITSLLPHKSFTSKGAYVACSRARKSCILHTPNNARLTERLPEGNRRAALDVLSEM